MTPANPISYHTSPYGLRMVHLHVPRSAVGYCGLAVMVGSRDEDAATMGLAHFVEHTIFKGTSRRSPWHIINRMEAVGGELNAFTTKEETVVYSAFPGASPARGADLIADLVCNSQFPARELDKEREVVADEIDSYLDSPSEAVYDDFEDLLFAGSSIGHNILGTRAALDTFDSQLCRDYLHRWYVAPNMVAFYAGSMKAERVFDMYDKIFADCAGPTPERSHAVPPIVGRFNVHRSLDTHQCHTVAGARTAPLGSPETHTISLLNNIIGGPGMNSLLNIALRERRGLVYSVESSTGLFSDCGELTIYYGCDPADNDRCLRLVEDTVARVADGEITDRRLQAAKKQFMGQLVIASENLESRILAIARRTLFCGRALTPGQLRDAIEAITPTDLSDLAATLQPLSSLTFGPSLQ